MKRLATRNAYVQHESPITSGKTVMAKVKFFFVHASNADVDENTRAMTLAPLIFVPARFKLCVVRYSLPFV